MMSQTNQKNLNPQAQTSKVVVKENPSVRAEKAYESIRQTITLNEKLQKIGAISNSFGLRKATTR